MSKLNLKTKAITKLGFNYIGFSSMKKSNTNSRYFKHPKHDYHIIVIEDGKFIIDNPDIKYKYCLSIVTEDKTMKVRYYNDHRKMYKKIKDHLKDVEYNAN